jgi:hypothetical protein
MDAARLTSSSKESKFVLASRDSDQVFVEKVIPIADLEPGVRTFDIRAADSHSCRGQASELVSRMYARRGYETSSAPVPSHPKRRTFLVKDGNEVMGTLTINVGAESNPLKVEECFAPEVAKLKAQDLKLCEYTRLAMTSKSQSPRVLAALFHVAHIFAHLKMGVDKLLIEVNPRHVRYYKTMLGFKPQAEVRHNPRVNADAVLLSLDLQFAQQCIDDFWKGQLSPEFARSAYPMAFSPKEQAGIAARMDLQDNCVASVSEVHRQFTRPGGVDFLQLH